MHKLEVRLEFQIKVIDFITIFAVLIEFGYLTYIICVLTENGDSSLNQPLYHELKGVELILIGLLHAIVGININLSLRKEFPDFFRKNYLKFILASVFLVLSNISSGLLYAFLYQNQDDSFDNWTNLEYTTFDLNNKEIPVMVQLSSLIFVYIRKTLE